jgi:hypothetical protein
VRGASKFMICQEKVVQLLSLSHQRFANSAEMSS